MHGQHVPVCVSAFDLMELDGRDLRELPLGLRRSQLKRLLNPRTCNLIRSSDSFADPVVLEGIVRKRKDLPYRLGPRFKVKTEQWKAANQYRAKLVAKA